MLISGHNSFMNLHAIDDVGVGWALWRLLRFFIRRHNDHFNLTLVKAWRELQGKGAILDTAQQALYVHPGSLWCSSIHHSAFFRPRVFFGLASGSMYNASSPWAMASDLSVLHFSRTRSGQ